MKLNFEEKKKQNKGITLIALIITIIVLLILAVVAIRAVSNDGIISHAKNAQTGYEKAQAEEEQRLLEYEYEIAKAQGTYTGSYTQYALDKKYPGVKIGDYVNYDPTLGATEAQMTYTSYSLKNASSDKNNGRTSGSSEDQSFDARIYKNAGFSWRVLDVKNGQLRLIADTDVGPGDYSEYKTYYYIGGQAGYIDKVEELNAICGIFGHGKGAASATSITVDDINAITGYNPRSPRYNQGSWDEYESEVTYTRGNGSALSSRAKLKSTKDPLTWTGTQNTFKYYNGTEFVDLTGSKTITSTVYSKDYNDDARKTGVLNADGTFSAPYEILFGKYKYDVSNNYDRSFSGTRMHSYWLASEFAAVSESGARWGLHDVYGTSVTCNYPLYYSYNGPSGYTDSIRPVVSLKSDVQIDTNAQDGKTPSTAYEIK